MDVRVRWLRRGALSLALLGATPPACGSDAESGSGGPPPSDDSDGQTTEGSGGEDETGAPVEAVGANVCLQALPTSAGVFASDLRGRDSNNGGPCGDGGPDVFFALDVPVRADLFVAARAEAFEPKIGVLGSDCAADWADAGLLCAPPVGGWVTDLSAGARVWVSVGWEEDPATDAEALPFELEVRYRRVLAAGSLCEPESLGRCEGGTACRTAGDAEPARCEVVPGDRCSSALELDLAIGETQVEIPPDAGHTDAHTHGCGGARTGERVYRISASASKGGGQLEVEAPEAAAIALRGPTCLPDDELACIETPATRMARAELGAGSEIYLFVELPTAAEADAPEGEEAPQTVHIRLTAND